MSQLGRGTVKDLEQIEFNCPINSGEVLLCITTIEKYFKSRNYCDVDTALSVDPICCELRTES